MGLNLPQTQIGWVNWLNLPQVTPSFATVITWIHGWFLKFLLHHPLYHLIPVYSPFKVGECFLNAWIPDTGFF